MFNVGIVSMKYSVDSFSLCHWTPGHEQVFFGKKLIASLQIDG